MIRQIIISIISTSLLLLSLIFLVLMIYKIRRISKGPPSWITNMLFFVIFVFSMLISIMGISFYFTQKGIHNKNTKQINFIRICWGLYRGTCCNSHLHSCTKFQHTTRGNKQNRHLPDKTRKLPKPKMARACSVPAVCVRAVDCWQ